MSVSPGRSFCVTGTVLLALNQIAINDIPAMNIAGTNDRVNARVNNDYETVTTLRSGDNLSPQLLPSLRYGGRLPPLRVVGPPV